MCSAVQALNIDTVSYLCHLVHCGLFQQLEVSLVMISEVK